MDQIETFKELIAYREITVSFQKLYEMRNYLDGCLEHIMRHTTTDPLLPPGPHEGFYAMLLHTYTVIRNAMNQMIAML